MKRNILIGVAIVVVLFALWLGGTYNSLVGKNEQVNNQWAQVEAQYQRRLDLIPNLVQSVKGAMKQEQAVFDAIAEARTRYAGARNVDEKAVAAGQVETAFGRLLAVMENYPQLKSVEAVQTLMAQLEGTENRVSVERARYNDSVRDLDTSLKRFPTNIVASLFNFAERPYFQSVSGADKAPTVQF